MKLIFILNWLFVGVYGLSLNGINQQSHQMHSEIKKKVTIDHCDSLSVENPYLDVTISHTLLVKDHRGNLIQHANHYILYEFTLNQVVDLNIVSGLPLKLYPKHTGELFTYGIYVPEGDYDMHNIDLDFESIDMPHTQLKQENDENNSDVMSLLKSNAEKIDVVVLVDSNSRLQEKVLTIQLWSDPDSQKISHMVESFKVSIPERESYKSSRANSDNHKDNQQHNWYHHMLNHGVDISKDNSQEDSLREVKLQYYRGCDYYTKLNEITEYMKAALVSFVSPFVILGVIFSGIALCVFVWLNYPFRQPVEPIPEKA